MARRSTRVTGLGSAEALSKLIGRLEDKAVLDVYKSEVHQIVKRLIGVDEWQRDTFLKSFDLVVGTGGLARDERVRIAAIKLVVALLPRSIGHVERALASTGTRGSYELHFTFFCFLNAVLHGRINEPIEKTVRALVEKYLHNVRTPAAHAAWMAGDLLGDHWPLPVSLPVLLRQARTARFVAGREGALHGLSHALERAPKREQWRIVGTLRSVSRTDRSRSVRAYADAILGALRGM